MDVLMILVRGLVISAESLNRRGDMLSKPDDLLLFNFLSSARNSELLSYLFKAKLRDISVT